MPAYNVDTRLRTDDGLDLSGPTLPVIEPSAQVAMSRAIQAALKSWDRQHKATEEIWISDDTGQVLMYAVLTDQYRV